MPTAYVFVHCTAGSEERSISEIARIQVVKEVRGTYGIHDIFVKVKAPVKAHRLTFLSAQRALPGRWASRPSQYMDRFSQCTFPIHHERLAAALVEKIGLVQQYE
jgi:hypothetical protein